MTREPQPVRYRALPRIHWDTLAAGLGLPDDVRIIHIEADPVTRTLGVAIESDRFRELPIHAAAPIITVDEANRITVEDDL